MESDDASPAVDPQALLLEDRSITEFLLHLTVLGEKLFAADGSVPCGLVTQRGNRSTVLTSSSPVAARLDQVHHAVGEGPALQVDSEGSRRWGHARASTSRWAPDHPLHPLTLSSTGHPRMGGVRHFSPLRRRSAERHRLLPGARTPRASDAVQPPAVTPPDAPNGVGSRRREDRIHSSPPLSSPDTAEARMRESIRGRETQEQQRRLTLLAIECSRLTLHEVWLRYFEYTGVAGQTELEAHLQGLMILPVEQADILSHAVNELIDELPPRPRAPYSDDPAP